MKRDRLEQLFARATERALDAARGNVWNEIPDTVRYNFFPNQSYDLDPDGQSRTTHPAESLPAGLTERQHISQVLVTGEMS